MKKASFSNWKKSIKKTVVILSLTLGIISFASFKSGATDTTRVVPVEIKYVGDRYSLPVFQINLNNDLDEKVYLTLMDDEGNVLYTDVVKGEKYQRHIQFDGHEWDNLQITLVVSGKKLNQKQAFTINKTRRTVQDILVAKL
jgi:hypothetical protein